MILGTNESSDAHLPLIPLIVLIQTVLICFHFYSIINFYRYLPILSSKKIKTELNKRTYMGYIVL